ncbi:GNAT family N-acetyltransferase [Planococcus halocryophilus]|uniref:GNAT family N-acetyltransferase n=1 Tax=Planococcus halocryophilus TaxID=1215089 RepID=UPI001F0DC287|nr:GNAT family N-acetyltransferase [Planococcus halocryophilus]MCH4825254.1 GNAT family N-acetyltransferase [Planococcus halocryophilus]
MPYIQTERLTLVTFTIDMMEAAITNSLELAKISAFKVADGYPSELYKEIIPYKLKRYSLYPKEVEWEGIIIHKADHTIIGDMGFRPKEEAEEQLELGYSIVPSYQGFGYATEMALAMVKWGLEQRGVKNIVASCDTSNIASIRVLQKAGLIEIEEKNDKKYWSKRK